MNSKLDTFNGLAFVYDGLAKLVFGKSIQDAQRCFLNQLSDKRNILILGGGTGWILEEVILKNSACDIWYVEASSKMIELSQRKLPKDYASRVHFIHGTEQSLPNQIQFD